MKLSFRNRDEVLGLLGETWRLGSEVSEGRTFEAIAWRSGAWQLTVVGGAAPFHIHFALSDEAKPAYKRTRLFQLGYGDVPGGVAKSDLALLEALAKTVQGTESTVTLVDFDDEPEPTAQRRAMTEMTFSADGLAAFLAPEVGAGKVSAGQWRLVDIRHGTTALREENVDSYHLVFNGIERDETATIAMSLLRPGDQSHELTAHFGLRTFALWGADGRDADIALTSPLFQFVVEVVRAKDTSELIVLPDPGSSIMLSSRAVVRDEARELNLGVGTPCHQNCVFCSLMLVSPPRDEGDITLAKLKAQLVEARDSGIHRLRLNGIDPLTFTRLWELLALIREMGFTSIDTFTTARAFADPAFCDRFLAAQPEDFCINVPIYGLTAESHDAVTRSPGSFVEMWQGLENLLARCDPKHIELESVVVRQNLAALPALANYAREHQLGFMAHLAFPMSGSRQDPYLDSVVSLREIVETVGRDAPPDYVRGIHPCVPFWVERDLGYPAFAWWTYEPDPALQGTEYVKSADLYANLNRGAQLNAVATYRCPHVNSCVLAAYCPKSMYRLYVERFGWNEFRPVRLEDLSVATLRNAPELPQP